MFTELFANFLKKYSKKKIAIGIHRNADLDALCSAYALSTVFPNSVILAPNEMNRASYFFAEDFEIDVLKFEEVKKIDYVGLIIVDCASNIMIEDSLNWKTLCIIDHHQNGMNKINADLEIIESDSPATAQIISIILPKISANAAFALAIGIVSDTARFKNANTQTFEELVKLLKISGKSYAEVLAYAEPENDVDEKLGVFAAFRKARVLTYKNFVIATTIVNIRESEASSSLSEFADVTFAASWRANENETRISARARKHVPIKLNEILAKIGKQFSASGGGHNKAAGANAKEMPEKVLGACVEEVKNALDRIN